VNSEEDQVDSNTAEQKASGKETIPWYKSIVWGPLVLALIGAIIQITQTIVPITFGPAEYYDFSIAIQPGIDNIPIDSKIGSTNICENIIITDLHQWIKPYRHPVYVRVIRQTIPPGIKIGLQNKAGRLPLNIIMNVKIDNSTYIPGEYEIVIQGIGETGLVRNSTYFLNLQDKSKIESENYRIYSGYYPVGFISNGDVTLYMDPNGNSLTRVEYLAKYQIDPKIYLDSRKKSIAA
jgi:hypothetical protein